MLIASLVAHGYVWLTIIAVPSVPCPPGKATGVNQREDTTNEKLCAHRLKSPALVHILDSVVCALK